MQENRSFDHYFGTLRGVRGFGDPRPVMLPSGKPVWFQPDTAPTDHARYDLAVYGPNGFLRVFRGSASPAAQADLDVDCRYDVDRYEIELLIVNRGPVTCNDSASDPALGPGVRSEATVS